jgi:ferredoxin
MPAALAAGVGELGRNGMLMAEKFGARVHLGDPILTNMPLIPDRPLDIGVEDFCKVCRKCATTCPTNSISMEGKVVHNGVEKYKINWETCYRLRAYVLDFWEVCLTCVTVCPYTKPSTWWRTLAVESLKWTPFALRPVAVRALKFLDDTFWGKVPRRRVRWLNYDSGILLVKKERTGTNAAAAEAHGEAPDLKSKVGYYYPLKENTRRFKIMRERASRAKQEGPTPGLTRPWHAVQPGAALIPGADGAPQLREGRPRDGHSMGEMAAGPLVHRGSRDPPVGPFHLPCAGRRHPHRLAPSSGHAPTLGNMTIAVNQNRHSTGPGRQQRPHRQAAFTASVNG